MKNREIVIQNLFISIKCMVLIDVFIAVQAMLSMLGVSLMGQGLTAEVGASIGQT